MSKQSSLHPDVRREETRGPTKRKRHRPWLVQLRWKSIYPKWHTLGKYDTEELAATNLANAKRKWPEEWELRMIHSDLVA